jgi:hypothetical protein
MRNVTIPEQSWEASTADLPSEPEQETAEQEDYSFSYARI